MRPTLPRVTRRGVSARRPCATGRAGGVGIADRRPWIARGPLDGHAAPDRLPVVGKISEGVYGAFAYGDQVTVSSTVGVGFGSGVTVSGTAGFSAGAQNTVYAGGDKLSWLLVPIGVMSGPVREAAAVPR